MCYEQGQDVRVMTTENILNLSPLSQRRDADGKVCCGREFGLCSQNPRFSNLVSDLDTLQNHSFSIDLLARSARRTTASLSPPFPCDDPTGHPLSSCSESLLSLKTQKTTGSHYEVVNILHQLGWVVGCPDGWKSIVSRSFYEVVLGEVSS